MSATRKVQQRQLNINIPNLTNKSRQVSFDGPPLGFYWMLERATGSFEVLTPGAIDYLAGLHGDALAPQFNQFKLQMTDDSGIVTHRIDHLDGWGKAASCVLATPALIPPGNDLTATINVNNNSGGAVDVNLQAFIQYVELSDDESYQDAFVRGG